MVSQLIPPNYGIVDGDAFYVTAVVAGRPPAPGERVLCEAMPNTDGGRYAWRCLSVQLAPPETAPAPQPPAPAVRASTAALHVPPADTPSSLSTELAPALPPAPSAEAMSACMCPCHCNRCEREAHGLMCDGSNRSSSI